MWCSRWDGGLNQTALLRALRWSIGAIASKCQRYHAKTSQRAREEKNPARSQLFITAPNFILFIKHKGIVSVKANTAGNVHSAPPVRLMILTKTSQTYKYVEDRIRKSRRFHYNSLSLHLCHLIQLNIIYLHEEQVSGNGDKENSPRRHECETLRGTKVSPFVFYRFHFSGS